jgi:hypothetical protein
VTITKIINNYINIKTSVTDCVADILLRNFLKIYQQHKKYQRDVTTGNFLYSVEIPFPQRDLGTQPLHTSPDQTQSNKFCKPLDIHITFLSQVVDSPSVCC